MASDPAVERQGVDPRMVGLVKAQAVAEYNFKRHHVLEKLSPGERKFFVKLVYEQIVQNYMRDGGEAVIRPGLNGITLFNTVTKVSHPDGWEKTYGIDKLIWTVLEATETALGDYIGKKVIEENKEKRGRDS